MSGLVKHPNGCWIRNGIRFRYSFIMLDGRARAAHRISYELRYGSVPEGRWVCHHCAVKGCCSPLHLYAGTPSDNSRDRYSHAGPRVFMLHSRRPRMIRPSPPWLRDSAALDVFLASPPPQWLAEASELGGSPWTR